MPTSVRWFDRLTVAVFRKIHSYSRELAFILRNCADWRSRVTLFKNTVLFHVGNWAKKRAPHEDIIFSVNIEIGSENSKRVELRRFAGDIFVLYEVLCDKCYVIPSSMCPPEKVRVVFDCGANIGLTSLFFAAQYPNARIYSIEPDPSNFVLLQRNVRQERRILPICGALVGLPREQVYLSTDPPAWGRSIATSKTEVAVNAWTIDEICQENELAHIDLLKVDIEGAEKELFANGHFLKRVSCGIVELHSNYGLEALKRDVVRWGFRVLEPTRESGLKMISIWPETRASH
jgi:FkbM family methyltransferase